MSKSEQKMEQAMALHQQGFNCAQAVAMPFCEDLGLDPAFVMRAMEGFGAGMGGRVQTCGALSGAIFIAGLVHSNGDLQAPTSKMDTYAVCDGLCQRFMEKCGSGICKDIKGLETEAPLLSCDDCIKLGIELAIDALK